MKLYEDVSTVPSASPGAKELAGAHGREARALSVVLLAFSCAQATFGNAS
jgi:hypothetical protein